MGRQTSYGNNEVEKKTAKANSRSPVVAKPAPHSLGRPWKPRSVLQRAEEAGVQLTSRKCELEEKVPLTFPTS